MSVDSSIGIMHTIMLIEAQHFEEKKTFDD